MSWPARACSWRQALVAELMGVPGLTAAQAVRRLVQELDLPGDLKSVGIEPKAKKGGKKAPAKKPALETAGAGDAIDDDEAPF